MPLMRAVDRSAREAAGQCATAWSSALQVSYLAGGGASLLPVQAAQRGAAAQR